MANKIRVAILDDHQGIIDGYIYRLSKNPQIDIVGTARYGEELEDFLHSTSVDVLILDVQVPTSKTNSNPYPILHLIPKALQLYPELAILVISMHAQRTLIKASAEAGVSGYILKEDYQSIQELASIIRILATGGVFFSQQVSNLLLRNNLDQDNHNLSLRQIEALSYCASYPEASTTELAQSMGVANSTFRNLLSGAYLRLKVSNRTAAIDKGRNLGLLTPIETPLKVSIDSQ